MPTIRFQKNQQTASVLKLLENLKNPNKPQQTYYCLKERLEDVKFTLDTLDNLIADGLWEQGRLFNADFELRWTKCKQGYDILVLAENALPKSLSHLPETWQGFVLTTHSVNIFLWGQYSKAAQGFIEVRIPRVLQYPPYTAQRKFKDGQEARLAAVEYRINGVTKYTRFKGVKPYVRKKTY